MSNVTPSWRRIIRAAFRSRSWACALSSGNSALNSCVIVIHTLLCIITLLAAVVRWIPIHTKKYAKEPYATLWKYLQQWAYWFEVVSSVQNDELPMKFLKLGSVQMSDFISSVSSVLVWIVLTRSRMSFVNAMTVHAKKPITAKVTMTKKSVMPMNIFDSRSCRSNLRCAFSSMDTSMSEAEPHN